MPTDTKRFKGAPQNWHAVTIHCGEVSCASALAMKHKRFLSRETPPRLPLPGCSRPASCRCRYRHFDDRREGPRREGETGMSGRRRVPAINRRSGLGRRSTD